MVFRRLSSLSFAPIGVTLGRAAIAAVLVFVAACEDGGGGSGGQADVTGSPQKGLVAVSLSGDDLVLTFEEMWVGGTLTLSQEAPGAAAPVVVTLPLTTSSIRVPTDVPAATLSALTAGPAGLVLTDSEGLTAVGEIAITERFTRFFEATADASVTVSGAPAIVSSGATVTVSGSAGTQGLQRRVWIASPSGPVSSMELDASMVAPGANFSFDVTLDGDGVHVIELTGANGLPAAVVPIYVGAALPLATSALDGGFTAGKTIDAEAMASEILALVNERRQGAGFAPLDASPKLTGTAQFKADEMASAKYFAHSSAVTGKTVVDLAAEAGVTGQVAENIGVEYTALRVFLGWWWSPAHRAPLMDALTKSHGLGAAIFDAASGQVVFAQHVGTE